MKRLNFILKEWTRLAWVSPAAQAAWEPRIQAASRAWEVIEREAVAVGVKPSCLQNVAPEQLADVAAAAAQRGLVALPLGQTAAGKTYSASSRPAGPGEPWHYRVVTTKPALAADWGEAWSRSDDTAIGRLLGFPPCCQAFFQTWWTERRWLDLTWPAAWTPIAGQQPEDGAPSIELVGPPEANILGRWVGIRLVSHMPCSFNCEASAAIGRAMADVGRQAGYGAEVDTIREVLSWPTEWSALHGIAEVKTPVYRVSTRTDATAEKLTVRYRGAGWPTEGARGLSFPYHPPSGFVSLTSLRLPRRPQEDAREWTDNGFTSREAMQSAHDVVLQCLPPAHAMDHVLDLGCGNGALLRRIPDVVRYGVEIDAARAGRAEMALDHVVASDIADVTAWSDYAQVADVIVLMPGRLLELPPDRVEVVKRRLRGKRVLAYAYGDWLTRHESLQRLLATTSLLGTILQEAHGDGVSAALLEVVA